MIILSITTSSKICGVAILEDTSIIAEINLDNGLTHSESLMPLIEKIFAQTNLSLSNIDFLGIPCIGVNSLDSLTYNCSSNGIICSLIDAKKNNVYFEIFENILNFSFSHFVRRKASFENIENLLLELKNINPNYDITFVGDGAISYKDIILEYLPLSKFAQNNNLSASKVGFAGFYNYTSGTFQDAMTLYLRKSEAEKKMEEKLNESK